MVEFFAAGIGSELFELLAEILHQVRASTFVQNHLRPAALSAGVDLAKGQRFGLHNLRDSLSTWLVNKGKVDPKTVQGMLWHSDIRTTMNLHTQDDRDESRQHKAHS